MKKILIFALAIAACDDARPRPSGPLDAQAPSDAHAGADARADAGADAGTPPDAIVLGDAANVDGGPGNNSVRGTPLEGILIDWPDRLELCNVWRENRSLEDERADQAHVTLLHADRPSLGSGDLGASEVPRGVLRRGTLAAEQVAIDPSTTQSNLTRYELTKNANDAYLSAEVEHNLGAAGVLYEELGVMRQTGDPRPVKVGAFEYEHSFALLRPGAAEPVVLDPCGGPPELDRALELATASDGTRSTTILRQFRTHEAFAGSFPVHLEAAQVLFSDQPYQALFADGWFSQTYAAQHHNWEERSLIDFRRDAGFYQTIYAPYLSGSTPVPQATIEIRLNHVEGTGSPTTVEVDTLDLAAHTTRTDTLNLITRWTRVDKKALLGVAAQSCASGADVFALGYGDYVFQMLTCPSASPPGFQLVGLVPVAFSHDMAQAGVLVPQSSIQSVTVDQRPGFRASIGGSTATITKSGTLYFVTVNDSAGMEKANYASEAVPSLELMRRLENIRAATAAQDTSIRLDRLWAGQGVGESSIYAPIAFEVTFAGRTVLVEAFDALAYTNTHHNWEDRLVARGEGLSITWSVHYIMGPTSCFVKVVRDSDGVELVPETELTLEP